MSDLIKQATAQSQGLMQPSPVTTPQVTAPQAAASPQSAPLLQKQGAPDAQMDNSKQTLDKFVENSLRIIHSPQVTDKILNTVKNTPDKIEGIGNESVSVADRLSDSAGQNKTKLPFEVIAHGMNAIVGEIANVVETAGLVKLEDEQKYQAYVWAVGNFLDRSKKKGNISDEDLMQLSKEAQATPEGAEVAKQFGGV